MRVLQINSVYGRGSTGRIVRELHRRVEGAGGASFVATGFGETDDQSIRRFGNAVSVTAHGVATRLLDRHGLASRGATADLVSWIRELEPDVVHLHNLHGYYLNYPLLFDQLRSRQTRILWTLHDSWAYTGHCAYYDFAGCERWRSGCGSCPQLRSYPTSWVIDRSAGNLRDKKQAVQGQHLLVVTPSRWLGEQVGASFLGQFPRRVIENDPDPLFTRQASSWRASRGLSPQDYVLLAVASSWVPRKGLDHLMDLSTMLRKDERLVVVGHLPRGHSLPDQVIHVPHTASRTELAELYSAADVYLNPTLEDNYPTTNLEALACGTPVVTFPTGGSPEALSRGPGLVTQHCSAESMREAVDEWRSAPPRLPDPPGASRDSWQQMGSKYLLLYREMAQTS